jgi:DNA-binding transcriptional LysR family regulator
LITSRIFAVSPYFTVIAEYCHLGRAAEVLGVGQPALSMSLRRLERAAQAKLVQRTPKGVQLTAVGRAFLAHSRRLRLVRDDLAREIADLAHARAGELRIGASPAITESLLPQVCTALYGRAPKITMTVTQQDNDALLPALRNGEVDLVVIHARNPAPPEIEQIWLREDPFVVYCAAGHPLVKRRSVKLVELAEECWASTPAGAANWLQAIFRERGLPTPRLSLISDSVTLRMRTVAASNLLGVASASVVKGAAQRLGLVILRIADQKWSLPIAIAHRKDAYLSPAMTLFIELLEAKAKEIVV